MNCIPRGSQTLDVILFVAAWLRFHSTALVVRAVEELISLNVGKMTQIEKWMIQNYFGQSSPVADVKRVSIADGTVSKLKSYNFHSRFTI